MNWIKATTGIVRVLEMVLGAVFGIISKSQKSLQDMIVRSAGYSRIKLLVYDSRGRLLVSEGFVKARKTRA